MSLTTVKPITCSLPPTGAPINGTHSKPTMVINRQQPALPLLQIQSTKLFLLVSQKFHHNTVKEKEKPLVQEASSNTTSRREMMNLTAAALGVLTLLPAAPAEARTKNPSIRQRIFEKLEKLREKAGLSKRKDEDVDEKPKSQDKPSEPTKEKEEDKSKTKIEAQEKPKSKDDGAEKKIVVPSKEDPSTPALPNILNGSKVEVTLP